MEGTIFWDVDTQYDFMRPDGKLYVPEAEQLVGRLAALTRYAHEGGIRVIASADDHVTGHRELSDHPDFRETFPPHCMRGTPGQRKIPETALRDPLVIEPTPEEPQELATKIRAHRGDVLFHKHWFDVFTNPNVEPAVNALAPKEIVVYGVALDVCNRYAIEGMLRRWPGVRITVVTDATKPIHAADAPGLLKEWADRGVRLATTDEILARR